MTAIIKALAAVSAGLVKHGIAKNKKNVAQGFSFRGIDDVYRDLSPLLSEHGIVIAPQVMSREATERQTAKGGTMFSVVVTVRYVLHCAEDGSSIEVVTVGEAMDTGDKATNKALSAAYKYMAFQTFCIPVDGQDDADSTTPEPVVRTAKPTPKPTAEAEAFPSVDHAIAASATITTQAALSLWSARVGASFFKGSDREAAVACYKDIAERLAIASEGQPS